jgi:hypothetical protein
MGLNKPKKPFHATVPLSQRCIRDIEFIMYKY